MVGKSVGAILWGVVLAGTQLFADTDWQQFRGPTGQGVSDAKGLPLRWDKSNSIVWQTPIQGQGWSSPVYSGDRVWLTSATVVAASEDLRQAKTEGKLLATQMEVAQTISLWAIEIDLTTGNLLRQIHLADLDEPQPIHSLNSYASPTPVIEDGRLYCHFGDYGTYCLETSSGKSVWEERLELSHSVGPGSSPLLYEDLLILPCDGMNNQFVVALKVSDGSQAWRTDRPPIRAEEPEFRKAFCTPLLIEVQGEKQLVIPGAQWCIAYEPRTGKEIWRVDHGRGFSNVPRPIFDGRNVYLCTGYGSSELWAIRTDGRGDVTDSHVLWKASKQIPNMPSPIVSNGRVYTIGDGGIAQCFEAATGKLVWKERIGGKFSASPLLADGRIYLSSHEGLTTVIESADEFKVLAENQLDGQIMASPVVVDADLLIRTDSHLYRIGE